MRNRCGHLPSRKAGHERIRARRRRRLPHLFHLCARSGRPLGNVPVARPRTKRAERDRRLVAPPRRVRQMMSDIAVAAHLRDRRSESWSFRCVSHWQASRCNNQRWREPFRIATAVVVLIAGALQFTAWKARQLACCREVPGHGRTLPADAATAWRHGLRLRHPLQLRVCWSNGDPPRCRGHGSPGHGSRHGRNHCRTASTEWQTCRASYRGHRRSGRDVLDRDSNSRALMMRSLQFKSDTNSPRYMHVPNCAWTATLASWEGAGGETQA